MNKEIHVNFDPINDKHILSIPSEILADDAYQAKEDLKKYTPTTPKDLELFNRHKELIDEWLLKDKTKRWAGYYEHHKISKELLFQEFLPLIPVEQDSTGRLILYHVTVDDYLPSILNQGAIKPSSQTGKIAWGLPDYSSQDPEINQEQYNKVYLTTKKNLEHTASSIQSATGGGVCVLQVVVNPDNLRPDEDYVRDNYYYSWLTSLLSHSCSHCGEITEFKIVARRRPPIGRTLLFKLMRDFEEKADKEIITNIHVIEENDLNKLNEAGLNLSYLPDIDAI